MPPAASSFSGPRIHPLLQWYSPGRIAELNPSSGPSIFCLLPESEVPRPGDPAVKRPCSVALNARSGPVRSRPVRSGPADPWGSPSIKEICQICWCGPRIPTCSQIPCTASVILRREVISADAVQGGFSPALGSLAKSIRTSLHQTKLHRSHVRPNKHHIIGLVGL